MVPIVKKNPFQLITAMSLLVYCINLEAASFDCAKASTNVERAICDNETASQLDEELGQAWKEALIKYPGKKEMLLRQQRNWIKWIRNSCDEASCLNTFYSVRLGEVREGKDVTALNGLNKPNFIIVDGGGEELCEEYLNILNKTPRDELKACKLPDLTGSPIQPVEFKPLQGDALKSLDKIIYEQDGGGPHLDWAKKWPEREKEYATGYRKLSEAYWDLDKDGEDDHIVNESYPYSGCITLKAGDAKQVRQQLRKEWDTFSKQHQRQLALDSGYVNFYKLIKDNKINFVDAENFVSYKSENISIGHQDLTDINVHENWVQVKIWAIDKKRDDKYRDYGMGNSLCKFWFSN